MKSALPLLLLLPGVACTNAAPSPSPGAEVPAALARAHDAFLAADRLGTSLALKDVLVDEAVDPDVRDNALALLEAAYERGDGAVPADWSLPRGLRDLELAQVRVEEPDQTRFVVYLGGHVDDPNRLEQLRLFRGTEALLDQAAGVGKLKVDPEREGETYFSLEASEDRPLGPGVYGVRLELRGAPAVDGWLIAGDLTSAAAPRVHSPGVEAVVHGNPTLSFEDFSSPARRPFERRTLSLYLSRQDAGPAWQLWTADPDFTELVIGQDPRGEPQTTLSPGRYWIGVSFNEKRRFGPMQLGRASRTLRPFWVR